MIDHQNVISSDRDIFSAYSIHLKENEEKVRQFSPTNDQSVVTITLPICSLFYDKFRVWVRSPGN